MLKIQKINKNKIIKGALIVAGIIILRKIFFGGNSDEDAENEANLTDLQKLEKKGIVPNYSDSQYYIWADKLESAMFDIGTNEDSVYNVYRNIKNDADFLKLEMAFGEREYTGGYVPGVLYGNFDLSEWLEQELVSSEIGVINWILYRNGVNYRY
jgi:hypothetical protein